MPEGIETEFYSTGKNVLTTFGFPTTTESSNLSIQVIYAEEALRNTDKDFIGKDSFVAGLVGQINNRNPFRKHERRWSMTTINRS
ncbi:MAG: hypothetical protein WKF59_14800 [Chitinophagaceae bacterium]